MQGPLSRSETSSEHPNETDVPTRPITSPSDPFGSAPVIELRSRDPHRKTRAVTSEAGAQAGGTQVGGTQVGRAKERGAEVDAGTESGRGASRPVRAETRSTNGATHGDAMGESSTGGRTPSAASAPPTRTAGTGAGAQVLVALRDASRAARLERDLLDLDGCARVRRTDPTQAHEGVDARDHVVVLELESPDEHPLVERIAARHADARLVILVSHADPTDRATLMDAGADHVLDRATAGSEILASVATHVRRLGGGTGRHASSEGTPGAASVPGGPRPPREPGAGSVQVGTAPERVQVEEGLVVDLGRMQIERGERCLDLTPLEAGILGHVMRNSDRVVARDEILEVVWGGRESRACARTVDVHVVALRRKLHGGTSGSQRLLRTVRGLGYRWCG